LNGDVLIGHGLDKTSKVGPGNVVWHILVTLSALDAIGLTKRMKSLPFDRNDNMECDAVRIWWDTVFPSFVASAGLKEAAGST
jgi:hypothetical protein